MGVKVYLLTTDENIHRKRYVVVNDTEIVYPEKIDMKGIDFLDWVKFNRNVLKEYINKNGIEKVDYIEEKDKIELVQDTSFQYYFRIWYEGGSSPKDIFKSNDSIFYTNSIEQFSLLTNQILNLFDYIKPSQVNKMSHGNVNRNLILLSCTEIEAQIIQILEINGYEKKERYTTNDFFEIKEFMKLDEFELTLKYYPEFGALSPFKNWDKSKPTKSLNWLNSYNKIKHNREEYFEESTLENVLNSYCGLYILLVIQYGSSNIDLELGKRSVFQIKKRPLFKKNSLLNTNLLNVLMNNRIQYFKRNL